MNAEPVSIAAASTATPGLAIDGLAVAYGGQRVIENLSLTIEQGCFFTLLGPSGCGKTTLLRTIAGFIQAAEGRLLFGGSDVTRLPPHRRNIGMVFQDYALFPDKTVFDNVAYGLRARRVDEATIRRKVAQSLDHVGLGHLAARHPAALSGGQRQRVALARALVIEPQLLLMDEPLSNLDAKLRVQVREVITELQREAGITTIFVTHDQDEALAMSDRIGVMNRGRLEQVGPPSAIYREPATGYVADFVGAANLVKVTLPAAAAIGPVMVPLPGGVVTARAPATVPAGHALLVARPEEISLTRDGEGLTGTVRRRQYLGGRTTYKVELPEGLTLAVDLHGDRHDAFQPGDLVRLGFDPLRTLVLAS
ncbi:ABC transporter ATP-binding protein [Neoroseomonas oryzicola]|uniref:ABC transporter ATP-binding protein n=1 Tax=Neoroseomonas oryzicola TaxID=535904 RepID=A0A9X9WCC3_9PROT|nr:ABC transporter ATP-binding protein [Neoroseomonas oryzicola]MBR0657983.1 ABC transporter ATP-binding protein [Neoroseomonas oryzicola]NKE18699.1 ABC transporter ATP-binding protein [Neoroseomonas oryzicola]